MYSIKLLRRRHAHCIMKSIFREAYAWKSSDRRKLAILLETLDLKLAMMVFLVELISKHFGIKISGVLFCCAAGSHPGL